MQSFPLKIMHKKKISKKRNAKNWMILSIFSKFKKKSITVPGILLGIVAKLIFGLK